MDGSSSSRLGARVVEGGVAFVVWAPTPRRVELCVREGGGTGAAEPPVARRVGMERDGDGYWRARVEGIGAGARYGYSLDGGPVRPDPASRFQPDGVHGWSEVVGDGFAWEARGWAAPALAGYVIYELHVGTFTPEGTFDAAVGRLDSLRELGITAVEVMPIAQFPGTRNWGYDGVGLYAAQNSYGGPRGFQRFVDACHARGLAVVLDVVYNHLGPEGNSLREFGPYFTEAYKTPWGAALNFDGPDSDHVRRFFVENALYWVTDCRVDALRLDAVHAIVDASAVPFVRELCEAVHRRGAALARRVHVIAESAANDARTIRSAEAGGIGADAQWNDDFHHALHTLLTGERSGYYASYGSLGHLRRAFARGFVYTGEYSVFHRRRFGSSPHGVPAERFMVCSQNHDQVGNRMLGERLSALVGLEKAKLAAAVVLLSPFVPLLFMGEEYMEPAPFLYFVSHTDPELVDAVRKGRAAEFAEFQGEGAAPDPQSEETFARSKLRYELRDAGPHADMLAWYRDLLRLRRERPALAELSTDRLEADCDEGRRTLRVRRWSEGFGAASGDEVFFGFNFGNEEAEIDAPEGAWELLAGSGDGAEPAREVVSDGDRAVAVAAWGSVVYGRRRS